MSDSEEENDIGVGILFGNIGADNKLEADYLGEVRCHMHTSGRPVHSAAARGRKCSAGGKEACCRCSSRRAALPPSPLCRRTPPRRLHPAEVSTLAFALCPLQEVRESLRALKDPRLQDGIVDLKVRPGPGGAGSMTPGGRWGALFEPPQTRCGQPARA
jgi:hypothetical protein